MGQVPPGIDSLLDWKRRIAELYARIRRAEDPGVAWNDWRATRDLLFAEHPQSPLPDPASFKGLDYFDYDPALRVLGTVQAAEEVPVEITTSTDGTYSFVRYAEVKFELLGEELSLDCLWLTGYGGGLFLSFRDETSGSETYGACRYLYDTVKGADLGEIEGKLVLDFNFAYNPSCSYDPRWVCPLAPPPNRLDIRIEAGEKHVER